MIPVKLALEAFGPFARRQEIDFTAFEDDRIFLISGPTGSGKTTIFDAITFSLFGTASGEVRAPDSFKSDFAGEDDVCSVIFEFIVQGKKYTVHREPIQYRRKRGGNLVRENSVAELYFEDGTILAGPVAVDQKIIELLGINADQFRKIVMLPQGEFRKFLSDDASERQATLRRIFSTGLLEQFTEQLRQNAAEIKSALETLEAKCEAVADTVHAEENAALREALSASARDYIQIQSLLSKEIKEGIASSAVKREELASLREKRTALRLDAARETNEKFRLLAENESALERLLSEEAGYAEIDRALAGFLAVRELAGYADALSAVKAELSRLESGEKETLAALGSVKSREKAAAERLERAAEALAQKPKLLEAVERLKLRQNAAGELESLLGQRSSMENELTLLQEKEEELHQHRAAALLREELRSILKEKDTLSRLRASMLECTGLADSFRRESQAYQLAMNRFIESQAYLLAGGLQENKPCPVCGSTKHPHPAPPIEQPVDRDELEKVKESYERSARLLKEAQGSCREQLLVAGFPSAEGDPTESLPGVEAALSAVETKLTEKQAGFSSDCLDSKQLDISEIEAGLSEAAARKAVVADKLQTSQKSEEAFRAIIGSSEATVASLQREMDEARIKIDGMEREQEEARNQRESLLRESERLSEALSQIRAQLSAKREEFRKRDADFENSLQERNLTEKEFQARRLEAGQMEALQQKRERYQEAVARRRGAVESLKPQLSGLSPVDLDALQEEYDSLSVMLEEGEERLSQLEFRLAANREAHARLFRLQKQYGKLHRAYQEKQKLFDVASGKQSGKLSFERYVLASYFGDVIENANRRLERMTNSRYTLSRRQEREKGNRISGLSLEVFDAYTGKSRHVNTLSGGESFKIALCLALGLADIISQNSGGIELNTMFIDEGFGSLDQNSLDAAIQCLNDLRSSGRYIGIISHVSELKEKIPAKLLVVEEPQGSHIEMQV